jgi:hypothetical protein
MNYRVEGCTCAGCLRTEPQICRHCGYSIHIAESGEFAGKYVHALTGNQICALSAELPKERESERFQRRKLW